MRAQPLVFRPNGGRLFRKSAPRLVLVEIQRGTKSVDFIGILWVLSMLMVGGA